MGPVQPPRNVRYRRAHGVVVSMYVAGSVSPESDLAVCKHNRRLHMAHSSNMAHRRRRLFVTPEVRHGKPLRFGFDFDGRFRTGIVPPVLACSHEGLDSHRAIDDDLAR